MGELPLGRTMRATVLCFERDTVILATLSGLSTV